MSKTSNKIVRVDFSKANPRDISELREMRDELYDRHAQLLTALDVVLAYTKKNISKEQSRAYWDIYEYKWENERFFEPDFIFTLIQKTLAISSADALYIVDTIISNAAPDGCKY